MLLSLQDTLPHILEYIVEVDDLVNVDLTCTQLKRINENTGWKTLATNVMAIPLSYKEEAGGNKLTWKSFLSTRVKPIFLQLSRLISMEAVKKMAQRKLKVINFKNKNPKAYENYTRVLKDSKHIHETEICRAVLSRHDWPLDVGIFIACHCYLSCSPLKDRGYYFFDYDDVGEVSTERFAFWDSFSLGGGDTQWWSYVVLKGSVKVPLAPKYYHKENKRGEPVEIGRGGIIAFSHWNHGGCQTTAKHIHPHWDPTEFGIAESEEEACDYNEWVRVNVEEPVQASGDSLPAAWRSIFDFMDELELTLGKY